MNEGQDRIDYQETSDVTDAHAAVKREKPEPSAETTPMPLWLTALCGVAVLWAGAYFGIFHGGLSGNIYNEYQSGPGDLFPLPKTGGDGPAAEVPLAQQGKSVYTLCVGCHGGNGMGVPGQFPPLAGSDWVKGGEKRLLAVLLKGLTGPITVNGKLGTYGGNMVAWEGTMSSKKIAAVASYVRAEWGNGAPEVTEADVEEARKEFAAQKAQWTEAQIQQIPADANYDTGGAAPAGDAKPAAAPAAAAPAAGAPAPAAGAFDLKASIERGKAVYMQTCFACHQPTGMGLPGAFPPLSGSEHATGDPRKLVAILMAGINPPLTVKGVVYVAPMPSPVLSFPILKDDKNLADVLNYVRNNFGNKDEKGLTPEFVGTVRKEFESRTTPWTEAELKNFPPPAK